MNSDYNKIREIDSKYYMPLFNRLPVAFTHGLGSKLYDTTGKEYTDFVGGIAVNCLGHGDGELIAAITEQAGKIIHTSGLYYNDTVAAMVELLMNDSDFSRVFLSNSGAEANECAIKLIRKHFRKRGEKRFKIITANNSFHGRTLAAITATGQPKYSAPFAPLPAGFEYIPYNDINALKKALSDDQTAALMLETIQGEAGVICADYEYLTMAYTLCKAKGVLFVLDEIQTGCGRTGKLFSYSHTGVLPDIITLAKGLGGGVPIGATLARGEVAEAFALGEHGSTFGGNPLACAAARVVLRRLKTDGVLEDITTKGEHLHNRLLHLKKHPAVLDVRGKGLLQGLELAGHVSGAEIVGKMLSRHFVLNCAGNNTLRFAPPFVISIEEIDAMTDALDNLFQNI